MRKSTVCIIHEAIGSHNAIAKITMDSVRQALKAGFNVTVVAKFLDESLKGQVEWLPLFVPPRLFLFQWLSARPAILAALGKRKFDVIHVNQPQVASIADVMQCHFLTRVAYERHCLETRHGIRPAIVRIQQQGVLHAEDFFYRHLNPKTRMVFCSEMLQNDFHKLYGRPNNEAVLSYSFPPINFPTENERNDARVATLGGVHKDIIVGYLGGIDERKGYRRLIKALEGENNIFLLIGGIYTDDFVAPTLKGRFKAVGLVSDTATFYAACDVFIVPSIFDPLPLAVFEAVSRGVPVIVSENVGTLPHLLKYNAGVCWKENEPLVPLIYKVISQKAVFNAGARRMAEELSEEVYGRNLLKIYEEVLNEKHNYNGKDRTL